MKSILVLCTGNSCRSQMAEGYFKFFAPPGTRIESAGVESHGLNERAVQVMKEDGVDISGQTSNPVSDFLGEHFDIIITVCNHAAEKCPVFPGVSKRFHQDFRDPSRVIGTEEEIMLAFREVRDQIRVFCKTFISENL